MTFRQGIVVDVHPEDHSVDLVMLDDGSRVIGAQVISPNGSTRSGSTNMPSVPKKQDKWDITKRTGQDQIALVAFVRNHAVVVGYLFPQISQMTFKEKDRTVSRHTSDVYTTTDDKGNTEIYHPSGAYIKIGETPDHDDLTDKNFDKNFKLDRNTGKQIYICVKSGDNHVTIDPSGKITVKASEEIILDAPKVSITGELRVAGNAIISGISFVDHPHTGVTGGSDLSGPPAQ